MSTKYIFSLGILVLLSIGFGISLLSNQEKTVAVDWPVIEQTHKPWAYWWWMGSAVDRPGLTSRFQIYSDAGMGGMHIVPIYGVRGWEERFIPYLSPEWMQMLAHSATEANSVGMGIDMTVGTGWPFGGPHVGPEHAAKRVIFQTYELTPGEHLDSLVRHVDTELKKVAPLQALVAFSEHGEMVDLTDRVSENGTLSWSPENGRWKLIAVFQGWTGQQVKRAAPGAAGNVMNYFSRDALVHYLARFDSAFADLGSVPIRAFYNDSYEVYGANWTDDFFMHFERLRDYDLREYLPYLLGEGDEEIVARVKADYRETISELLLEEFMQPWVAWAHEHGALTRNQAHGSPGNLLDLYAAADIPETEAFGAIPYEIPGLEPDPDYPEHSGTPDELLFRFASSAAHVKGSKLVSSETATWLGEHFRVSLAMVKPELDQLFVGGINHIFFHGNPYSPPEAEWPGWLFYASTHFGPSNTFWRDIPAFNRYIARSQSFLQSGNPDNDVLLYFPIHDVWHDAEGLLKQLSVHNADEWFYGSSMHQLADQMESRGYSFDYVSDLQLENAEWSDGFISMPGGTYRTIMIPDCQFLPVETMEKLVELVEAGATVIFYNDLPTDVPGLANLQERQERFEEIRSRILSASGEVSGIRQVGRGHIATGEALEVFFTTADVRREGMVDEGLQYVRRRFDDGHAYFVTNLTSERIEGWIPISVDAETGVLFNPAHDRYGAAALREGDGNGTEVYLQLSPGESNILRTFETGRPEVQQWQYVQLHDTAYPIEGTWMVRFVEGGPVLPEAFEANELASWTEIGGADAARFSGTARYAIDFDMPEKDAEEWILNLGEVRESARIWLNGDSLGTVWSHPFRLRVGEALQPGTNRLEVEVTNLAANRIADLDRRGVEWKRFHEINYVNINYQPFDASGWNPLPSGLLGPVQIIPADLTTEPAP